MDTIFSWVAGLFAALSVFLAGPVVEPNVGASLPQATAVFETSLAAPISSSATSFTLTENSVRGGGSISGYNCFTIDEGSAQAEFVCGTVSGTSVTAVSRGISPLTGTTTDSDLQFAHRRGANVKITDFPLIQILKAQNNGEDTFANILVYNTPKCVTGSASTSICDKSYIDNLANQDAATSTESLGGIVELGTLAEQANSFDGGSNQPTVLQTKNSTSTCQVVGSYNIVASSTTGKLDPNCIGGTTQKYTFTNLEVTTATTTTLKFADGSSQTSAAARKFGGSGADGALSITSGTTNIDLASATTTIKNYSSISITGTGALGFTNSARNGSIVILKSSGDCTLTSSATRLIDLRGVGATSTTRGSTSGFAPAYALTATTSTRHQLEGALYTKEVGQYYMTKGLYVIPGQGGENSSTGNKGGAGGGALIMECAGALNFTGTIDASGQDGTDASGGGGGGGSAGMVVVLYNTLTANSGTITAAGGTGGDSSGGTGNGGSGAGSIFASGGSEQVDNSNGNPANGKGAGGGGGSSNTSGRSGGAGGASMGGLVIQNSENY